MDIPQASGKIKRPKSGVTLHHEYVQVTGTLSFVPRGYRVWLAVKIGDRYWTKRPEIEPSPVNWTREVVKTGPASEDFSLVLLQVDAKGQCTIESWYRYGQTTGSYPGLRLSDFSGAVVVDKVEDLILK